MTSDDKPTTIAGGCVCESVRYTVTFPPSHVFNKACSTCQCSQCRKNTGSLLARLHAVPLASVAFTSRTNLERYHATPSCARGFCSQCGSFLFWCDENTNRISMAVGTFDKDVLKRWGVLLASAHEHLWVEDAIEGVSDRLPGERWKLDVGGEKMD